MRPHWLVFAVLAGCARHAPEPLEPDRILWELRAAPPFDPADGLSPDEAAALALLLNPDLKAERARKGVAEAQLLAAGLYPDPEIDARWIARSDGTVFEGSLLAALDTAGMRRLRREKARLRVAEVDLEIADAERRLAGEVRAAWTGLLAAGERAALAQESLAVAERLLALVRTRQEEGAASGLDTSLVSLEAARRRREAGEAGREREDAHRLLNRLIGIGPEIRCPLEDAAAGAGVTLPSDPAALESLAVSRRPDLAAARMAYEQAERDLAIAARGRYPRLRLGPSYGREEGESGLGLAAGIELPLWNRNRGAIAERLAERARLAGAFRAKLADLRAELASALAEAERQGALLSSYELEILPEVARASALTGEAIRAGKLDPAPLLALEEKVLEARREGLRARTGRRKALLRLEDLLSTPLSELPHPPMKGDHP